jgi:hypothetical protein
VKALKDAELTGPERELALFLAFVLAGDHCRFGDLIGADRAGNIMGACLAQGEARGWVETIAFGTPAEAFKLAPPGVEAFAIALKHFENREEYRP